MTKLKTVKKFESGYDGSTRRLKTGSVPADLVTFESLGLGKLPPVLSRARDNFVYGWTELQPTASARLSHTKKLLADAGKQQREADALAISAVISKGPEGFAELSTALDSVDLVAQAEKDHNLARRIANATTAANKGQLVYMGNLVGGQYREKMLDVLEKAWQIHVVFTTTDRTTLGEQARLQAVSTEAREIIGRLLTWLEGSHQGRGFNAAELKLVREAIRGEAWEELPTLDRIRERAAQDQADTPKGQAEAEAKEQARSTKAEADEANKRYAQQAAESRRGIFQKKSDGEPSTS